MGQEESLHHTIEHTRAAYSFIPLTYGEIQKTQNKKNAQWRNDIAFFQLVMNRYCQSLSATAPTDQEAFEYMLFAEALQKEDDTRASNNEIWREMLDEVIEAYGAAPLSPIPIAKAAQRVAPQFRAADNIVFAAELWTFDRLATPDDLPLGFHEAKRSVSKNHPAARAIGITAVHPAIQG
jgi:hypothetical protein